MGRKQNSQFNVARFAISPVIFWGIGYWLYHEAAFGNVIIMPVLAALIPLLFLSPSLPYTASGSFITIFAMIGSVLFQSMKFQSQISQRTDLIEFLGVGFFITLLCCIPSAVTIAVVRIRRAKSQRFSGPIA
ncbi:MAG: hypothetical protein AAGH99_11695 [Planctomycetota bacterium]